MSQDHRFTLEPYAGPGSRYHCPNPECKDSEKTFSRYIDTTTGQHLADHVGKCNRLNNCLYHFTPKQFFEATPDRKDFSEKALHNPIKRLPPPPASYIPADLFKASLRPGKPLAAIAAENTLIAFLMETFGEATAAALTARYFIGTSKRWPGATVFWQIDTAGRVRTGKIIQYLTGPGPTFTGQDCHRNKANTPAVQWVHKAAKLEGFNLAQCLFGEHLLSPEPYKPVGLVESEKTALIASAYFPEFVWLACGGLDQLSAGRCKALAGRSVTLFPDLKGLERWEAKSKELSAFCECRVSDLLERKASEADRAAGLDLADFLLRNPPPTPPAPTFPETPTPQPPEPLKEINSKANQQPMPSEALRNVNKPKPLAVVAHPTKEAVLYPLTKGWKQELDELEAFFSEFELPDCPVKVGECETISNPAKYIPAAIALVRQHHGHRIYSPYLERMKRLRDLFTLAEDLAPTNGPQTANTPFLQP